MADTNTAASAKNDLLDHLDGLAAEVDAEATGTLPNGELIADQPAPVDYATEAAASVDMFAALVGGYCAPAGALFTTEKKQAIAGALAPVLEKYGFTFGALPPEITLLIVAGPVLYQSSKLVAAQIRDEQAAAAKARPAAVQAPAAAAPVTGPEIKRHPQEALYPA